VRTALCRVCRGWLGGFRVYTGLGTLRAAKFGVLAVLPVLALAVVFGLSFTEPAKFDRALAKLLSKVTVSSGNPLPLPTGPVPREFFGMHVIDRKNWPTVPIGALGKGTTTSWTYIERSRGTYDWSNLDAWVDLAKQHGVDYFYSFDGFPQWATSDVASCEPANVPGTDFCGALPSDLGIIDEFVTAIATRYRGRIKYYELMNEPYAIGPDSWGRGMRVADLVTFAKRVIPIVRAIDPQAKIISPSMNAPFGYADYADRYYRAGGPTDVDIISLHAYADQPEDLTPSGSQLGPLLPIIARYGLVHKPLWDTEGAWTGSSGKDAPDTDQQVAFIARYYLIHWSEGLTRFYWYAWDNYLYGTLWSDGGGTSKAGLALQQVEKWMIGATLAERIMPSGTVWSGTFVRSDGSRARVVWDTSGSSMYKAPLQYTEYQDLEGGVHPIVDHMLPIGIKPILLESR
jgi:hypothetical protein